MTKRNNNIALLKENAFEEIYITTKHGISHVLQVGLREIFTEKRAYDGVLRVIFVVPGTLFSLHLTLSTVYQ